jgi:oxygen-dependent protoporphyrinogen oxidase
MSTIAVIGAGIAGLTAAYRLSSKHDVIVFERETVPGGKIRSQKIEGGFLFEWGPSAFLSSAEDLKALIGEIGLSDVLTPARPAAKKRFIYWNAALHALPAKPPDALTMTILSPLGKLRAVGELFVRKGRGADDESVYAFMRRRFGRQVAERLVSPALLGISGGDAAATSLAAIFPRLRDLEAQHGSVIRGMITGTKRPKGTPKPKRARDAASMYSFADGGMQTLTNRLAELLGDRLRTGVSVSRIERGGSGWRIFHAGGEVVVDGVIVATPADVAADLVDGFDSALAVRLSEITYAPMRAVGVAFRSEDVPTPLDGFGFLAARNQGVRILGAFYTSSIVPEHAPPGTTYVRIFLGGSTDPGIIRLDSDTVRAIVLADLRKILGISAEPVAYHEVSWTKAIPQYRLPHRSLVTAIEKLESAHPGFALAGNAYRGLGVGDNVRDALAVAARVGNAVAVRVGQNA